VYKLSQLCYFTILWLFILICEFKSNGVEKHLEKKTINNAITVIEGVDPWCYCYMLLYGMKGIKMLE
jgi:hypothetical protein